MWFRALGSVSNNVKVAGKIEKLDVLLTVKDQGTFMAKRILEVKFEIPNSGYCFGQFTHLPFSFVQDWLPFSFVFRIL